MILYLTFDQFHVDGMFFSKVLRNNVIENAGFVRFVYSTPILSMPVLYFLLPCIIEWIPSHNKLKPHLDPILNQKVLEDIYAIEYGILEKRNSRKVMQCKAQETLVKSLEKPGNYVWKISGIWETDKYIGLSFKFIHQP